MLIRLQDYFKTILMDKLGDEGLAGGYEPLDDLDGFIDELANEEGDDDDDDDDGDDETSSSKSNSSDDDGDDDDLPKAKKAKKNSKSKQSSSDDDDNDLDDDDGDDDSDPEGILDSYPEKDDDEDEYDIDLEGDDISDDAIVAAATQVKNFPEYMQAMINESGGVDNRFLSLVVQKQLDPKFLNENKIFSIEDFAEKVKSLQDEVDPDRMVVPQDPEELLNFEEKYMDIPKDPKKYQENKVFDETIFDEDRDAIEQLSEFGYSLRLSNEQLQGVVNLLNDEVRDSQEEEKSDLNEYIRENKKQLEEIYGDDVHGVVSNYKKVLHSFPDFLKQFKDSKVLNSRAFVDMINVLSDQKAGLKVNMKGFRASLRGQTDQQVLTKIEELKSKPVYEKYRIEGEANLTKSELRRYHGLMKILNPLLALGKDRHIL